MSREPMRYAGDDPPGRRFEVEDDVPRRDRFVRHHGGDYVYPGRKVVEGDWPMGSPEVCINTSGSGVWIHDGQILVCPDCGLDCT